MPPPPVQVFLTTIASQASLRQRQEYILRILQVRKVPFTSYDLASDEAAKRLWRRRAPAGKQELPGILVGGKCPGTFSEFEDAVEYGELDQFLRLKEEWDEDIDGDGPILEAKPVGVPGASSPSQMTNHKPSFAASPSPLRSKGKDAKEIDVGEELSGYGLQGVKVTDDELLQLVSELGLGGDEAAYLIKGLGGDGESKEEGEEDTRLGGDGESKEEAEEDTKDILSSLDTEDKAPSTKAEVEASPSAAAAPVEPATEPETEEKAS